MSSTSCSDLSSVLLGPIVSEKTTRSGDRENSVAFWVNVKANKLDIKKAVEHFFPQAKVQTVSTIVQARKNVRFGQMEGRTKKRKKAFVTLQKGTQINFAEFEG